ncbi:AsnC family protein [Streptomyces antioxidans]|uniref:AsnC family protein n=1 Tax=Streptomyces antioxidans TaxID=1507734 RepID=A0A1V4D4Y3_9ACTN|nr:Lrp/AsnC family transcriptional regulator [Streptomyces antioxidans]OPF79285.1 AsnC family protein [Streptomyces antioxidans]
MESDAYDDLDRALVHALQLDGRAPFSRLAEVLGVSDQTVARRYTRLRTTGALRVLGLTDPAAVGDVVWMVRVRCLPDAALPVAEALARRTDTSWVHVLSDGTEVAASTRVASGQDSDALLLRKLPQTPRVVGVSAHCVLHEYFGGEQSLVNKSDALTAEQIARLRPPGQDRPKRDQPKDQPKGRQSNGDQPKRDRPKGPRGPMSAGDRKLLDVLARDGRAPLAQLVAATGWSQSTVRRRLANLRADGTLYFDVDYSHRLFSQGVTTAIWLSVRPSELAATGQTLANHPEVAFACATTGTKNLLATVVCADVPALYTYLTTRIAELTSVRDIETSPILRRVKGPGPLLTPSSRAPWRAS